MAMLGLRGKSLLALLITCFIALIPAAWIAWQGIDSVRDHFGLAYARNHTLLNQQKIVAPVARELALARRLADSTVTREWLLDENDPDKRARFFREAASFQKEFRDHSYFLIDRTPAYYYNDDKGPQVQTPRYILDPAQAKDAWFFEGIRSSDPYQIQVDINENLGVTKVWFNIQVRDGDRKLGLLGTGLDLSTFLRDFMGGQEPGLLPVIFDPNGAIQAHPDANRIAYKSMPLADAASRSVFGALSTDAERTALRTAMQEAQAAPGQTVETMAHFDGIRRLLVMTYLPELEWYVMTAVDLSVAKVIDFEWLTPAIIALCVLLALLLLGFGYAVERLVLSPLRRLQQTAQAISAGRYDVALPKGRDEIGELSRAFGVMADKVRSHTEELEKQVAERTGALEEANREMAATHKKIDDSIDYASLIQRAILPDRQMVHSLGPHHFVLWRPRDVVGGDFYVFRADGENCLMGVVDCAGHGVPGALMTMLARAAIDHAINEVGADDPAAILARTDAAMRAMLQDTELPRALATNMDVGLVYVDRAANSLRFAGAKMSLYVSDGQQIQEYKGARRALGERRAGEYDNTVMPLDDRTFYLVTDGLLDQAGGEQGFGFGNRRFTDLLISIAKFSLAEQAAVVTQVLVDYQGKLPQRDDITMLSFRFK